MSRPLLPGDPAVLGDFWVDGRLQETRAGVVYLGRDPHGTPVAIGVVAVTVAADPAARARLRAAVDTAAPGLTRGWRVLAADVSAPLPWVVTAYDGRHPHAAHLLDTLSPRRPVP